MSLIDIRNLVFEYFRRDDEGNVEEMVEALSDVSMEIEQGDFVAVLGRNGSGKSTLAKQINALLTPSEGTVIVDGMDTEDEALKLDIRKTAGMVFQNPDNQIVGTMVEEDVAFGPENLGYSTERIWNQVDSSLEAVDMNAYRTSSPNQLSGGQKQRVAIAGVLAMNPKCIIFDEATSMLDPQGRRMMLATATALKREHEITIVWITHHMDEVLAADRVFVMKDGKLAAQGEPMQIFRQYQLLEECGLMLPPLFQYVRFLERQNIITEVEGLKLRSEQQLVRLLYEKYGKQQPGVLYTEEKLNYASKHLKKESLSEGILLNDVTYIYNKGFAHEKVALKNVNLQLGKGEFVAVIGHTGSGKSTLMQHLNGLYLPSSGNVYYDGQDIADPDYPMKGLRQKVGLVFQYPEYQLFAETVEQDVCFGPLNLNIPKVEAQKRAYNAIEAVGLPDTIYDASPLMLSGGQKRRVALAGILAMEPEFLILDEPTAGLDPYSAKQLLDMLKHLQEKQGITIVIVSHSMEEVAEYADRIVVMDQGEICMDGEVWQVFEHRDMLERLGLDVPVGIRLLQDLNKVGFSLDSTRCRQEEICMELALLKDIEV